MPKPKIRIAAVDDHSAFLDELTLALARVPGFDLVARGATAVDACRIEKQHRPDVMLLDLDIPGDGAAAARDIKRENPQARILILTGSADHVRMQLALAAGALGLLQKGLACDVLSSAIRCINAGVHVNSEA